MAATATQQNVRRRVGRSSGTGGEEDALPNGEEDEQRDREQQDARRRQGEHQQQQQNGAVAGGSSGAARDLLGFALPRDMTSEQERDRARSLDKQKRHSREWSGYAAKGRLPSRSKVKDLVREGGIPHEHRAWAWTELSGAASLRQSSPSTYFKNMASQGEERSKSLHQIELVRVILGDLPRTYPEHPWLHGPDGQAALRSVLLAYSMHNSKVGYCQGLNFVASTLLLATGRDAERAFWLLVALLDQVLLRDMYAPYLPGFQIEMKALGKLVHKKLPRLHRHLELLGCEMTILATDWFLCLFVQSLPHEASLWVLDCLICEGTKILYRVSLALLQLHMRLLLEKDNAGELLAALKKSVAGWWATDRLLAIAFDDIGGLPMKRIEEYRAAHRADVEAMVREREVARRKQELKEANKERERQAAQLAEERIDREVSDLNTVQMMQMKARNALRH